MNEPYNAPLIGIVGRKRAGKDTIAARLVEKWRYVRYAFADSLKDLSGLVLDGLNFDRSHIGWTGRDWTGAKSDLGRQLLVTVGDGARRTIDPEMWVGALSRRVEANAPQFVVVSDVRYPNEARWVRANSGTLIRVTRPDVDLDETDACERFTDTIACQYSIQNDDTIETLQHRVDNLMEYVSWRGD